MAYDYYKNPFWQKVMTSLKDSLAVVVSTFVIIATLAGFAANFASADDLKSLKALHGKDINRIEAKIDKNELLRKKDEFLNNITDYTNKIHELETKPNKSKHDKNLISYYRDLKSDSKTQLQNL